MMATALTAALFHASLGQHGLVGQNDVGDLVLQSPPGAAVRANGVDIAATFSTMQSTINAQEATIESLVTSTSTLAARLAAVEDLGLAELAARYETTEDRFDRAFGHMFAPSTVPSTSGPTATPTTGSPTAAPTSSPTHSCGFVDSNSNGLLDGCEEVGGTWSSPGLFAWNIPEGAQTAYVVLKGARGWKTPDRPGGEGGITAGLVNLTGIDLLHVAVGGPGTAAVGNRQLAGGGFNGGGDGRNNGESNNVVGGGGGSSDVRLVRDDPRSRILVAGGGGSATGNSCQGSATGCSGGHGGGLRGQDAPHHNNQGQHTGKGGTQSDGGAYGGQFFQGGHGSSGTPWNGGGGGGWYGGGSSVEHAGGGGGSSYANATFVRNPVLTQGGNDGAGWVQIRWSSQ